MGADVTAARERIREATITVEESVDDATARRFYGLYLDTFGELAVKAVARQVLHEHEFMDEMVDPRVEKYVAWTAEREAIGMCTLTKHLETVPWISPDYFAHNYPEHSARGAVYYLGFILVAQQYRRSRMFVDLVRRAATTVADNHAVCAYDICSYNDEVIGVGRATEALLRRYMNFDVQTIDNQTYYRAIAPTPRKLPEMRPRSS
jgi:hypothetical protein